MVRLPGESSSDPNDPSSDSQVVDDLKEGAHNDTTFINPSMPNHDNRSAIEGAPEQVNKVGTMNLDLSHTDSIGSQSLRPLNEEIQQDPPHAVDAITAAKVPLPESITPSTNAFDTFRDAQRLKYAKEIQRLRKYMPHLRNVQKPSRAHHRAEIKCLDFSGSQLVFNESRELESTAFQSENDFVQSLIGDIPSRVDHRVLIVDDLSDTLVSVLGSCLHITPELFEEHLLNSGWHAPSYGDGPTDSWSTRNLAKNYASVKWFRPIQRTLTRPYEERPSKETIYPPSIPGSWEERSSPKRRIMHSMVPLVNLLRRPWGTKIASEPFQAWEERATVWETSISGHHIVLLLLDPLPMVRHHSRIIEAPTLVQTRRRRRPHVEREESGEGGSSRDRARQSFFSRFIRGNPTLRNLLGANVVTTPETESEIEERPLSSSGETGSDGNQPNEHYSDHCFFTTSGARLPVSDYQSLLSPEKDYLLSSYMDPAKSTYSALEEMIQSNGYQAVRGDARIAPLAYLLVIILQDTLQISQSMDIMLNEIDDSMLDDELLQSRIDIMRRVLNNFEIETRHLETSISNFAQYTVGPEVVKSTGTCGRLLGQCKLQIRKVQERRRTTYGSLMTAMSLVESKRGISEAESVTKLTELAFFFIPLTFAASLFSMQVKELDADSTSVGVFFGVALTITVCSYALRLAIRSSAFLGFLRRWKNEIRRSSNSPSAAPIATTMVFKWIWNRLQPYVYPFYIMIPTAALLAGLWTRSLQDGIKAGVTIALVMIVFAVVLSSTLQNWKRGNPLAQRFARRLAP